MNVFNLSTSGIVFSHKLLCLTSAITGLYFLVRLSYVLPGVSLLFFVFAFDAVSYWTSMWDNAPFIPAMMADLKERLNFIAGRRSEGASYVKRVLRSVPCTGVQVGKFRSMERDATMIFLDFVIVNVANFLITF